MTRRGPDWMDLNAFVDGELTQARGEAVARAAAADPQLAAQIHALRRLKAAAAQSVEVLPADLPPDGPADSPPDLPEAAAPPRRPWLRRLQAAAPGDDGDVAADPVGVRLPERDQLVVGDLAALLQQRLVEQNEGRVVVADRPLQHPGDVAGSRWRRLENT